MTAVDWALTRDLSATKKLLLVGLAWIADDNGVTFKGQKTIAARLGQDPRWVREHLPGLAAAGLLSRYRRHRLNGSRTSDLLVLNMPRAEPLDLSHYSGLLGEREAGDQEPSGGNPPGGLAAEICEPSGGNPPGHTENQKSQPVEGEERAHDPREHPPEDFPDILRPHAREVYRILRAVAEQHGCKRVWPLEVGKAIMARPRHPLVAVAHDLALWAVDPPREIRDVVASYRTFLKRERELEATEHLAPDGTPGNGKAPAGVTHLRPNASAEERRMERQRQRAAKIAEYDRADSQPGHNGAMILAYPTTEEA